MHIFRQTNFHCFSSFRTKIQSVKKMVFLLQVYSLSVPLNGAVFSSPLYVVFLLLVSSLHVQTGKEHT